MNPTHTIAAMIAAHQAEQKTQHRHGDHAEHLRLASLDVAGDLFRRSLAGGEIAALLEALRKVRDAEMSLVWCVDHDHVTTFENAIEELSGAFEVLRDDLSRNLSRYAQEAA